MLIPKRVAERIQKSLRQYQNVLKAQHARDVSEADTVTVVKDMLADVFGYDKYAEVTSEHAIRGTYCDLAIQLDGRLHLLIEVKAIGLELGERHVRQTIDYAANQGVEWVILTNARNWVLYHVLFKKPIDKEEVAHLCIADLDARKEADAERLYMLSREGITKNALEEYRDRKDATSRFMIATILLQSEPVLNCIRREVRRVSGILVDRGVIEKVLEEKVIKREALEGEQAESARRRYARKADKPVTKRKPEEDAASPGSTEIAQPEEPPILPAAGSAPG